MEITELSNLVELYGDAVYGFCYKLTKNIADTDDLYQETFLKAMELCHKIDANKNPRAFLIGIAARLWKNKNRKYLWRQKIAPTEELYDNTSVESKSTPEDFVIANELSIIIHNAVDKLNDKYKIPLYMYYTAGMSIEEIALALKIPQGTVKSRLHNAKKALKKFLGGNGYEEWREAGYTFETNSFING